MVVSSATSALSNLDAAAESHRCAPHTSSPMHPGRSPTQPSCTPMHPDCDPKNSNCSPCTQIVTSLTHAATLCISRRELDAINGYLRFKRVPMDLRRRLNSFYNFVFSTKQYMESSPTLTDLPPQLRVQLLLAANMSTLAGVPIFKHSSNQACSARACPPHTLTIAPSTIAPSTLSPAYHLLCTPFTLAPSTLSLPPLPSSTGDDPGGAADEERHLLPR